MDKEKVIKQYGIPTYQGPCVYTRYSTYYKKHFIGISEKISQRCLALIESLILGYCTNEKLQNAFTKHPDSFSFYILSKCDNMLEAYDKANAILNRVDAINNGFNKIRIYKPRNTWNKFSKQELENGYYVSGIHLPAYDGCAVYMIMDTDTSQFYIGSTGSLSSRIRCHISALRKGNHPNPEMQAAFSDHPDSFIFSIMHRCSTEEEARKLEAIEIQSRNAIAYGFNRTNNLKLLPVVETCKRKSTSQNPTVFFFFFDIAS